MKGRRVNLGLPQSLSPILHGDCRSKYRNADHPTRNRDDSAVSRGGIGIVEGSGGDHERDRMRERDTGITDIPSQNGWARARTPSTQFADNADLAQGPGLDAKE